jgi:GntR family transcriptional regulator, transcriptional repressor for pyruvate dehydrogenase complex
MSDPFIDEDEELSDVDDGQLSSGSDTDRVLLPWRIRNGNVQARAPKTALLVARRIVRDIERMNLAPGDKLPPEKLMFQEYQVGRGTLREALRFLELQGILSLKPGPGGGPVVERPDASNLATLLVLLLQFSDARYQTVIEARSGLEPIMAELAAQRITPAALGELAATISTMATHVNDDHPDFLEANKRFHDIIAWSSGNALFGYLVDALIGVLDGTALGIEYPAHRRGPIHKAHQRIYQALEQHDPPAARGAMRDHIGEYVRYAERKFPQVLNRRVIWET